MKTIQVYVNRFLKDIVEDVLEGLGAKIERMVEMKQAGGYIIDGQSRSDVDFFCVCNLFPNRTDGYTLTISTKYCLWGAGVKEAKYDICAYATKKDITHAFKRHLTF